MLFSTLKLNRAQNRKAGNSDSKYNESKKKKPGEAQIQKSVKVAYSAKKLQVSFTELQLSI